MICVVCTLEGWIEEFKVECHSKCPTILTYDVKSGNTVGQQRLTIMEIVLDAILLSTKIDLLIVWVY